MIMEQVFLLYAIIDTTILMHSFSSNSTLANNWENSELLVMAKQKSTFGKDRVIGLAIVPFSSIREQASLTLGLAPSSYISDRGRAILNVLKVRGDDNFAKEFVALKMSQRETSQHDHSEDIKQTRD